MNLRRLVARSLSEAITLGRAFAPPPLGLRILMYHAIGSPALGDRLGLFSLSPARFKTQMDWLATRSTSEVVDLHPELPIDASSKVAISFDDGYLDNLAVAAPLLIERALPFTVFVTSDFVRMGHKGFLSSLDLRELAALPGARIGAHGASHIALSDCDDKKLRAELVSSKHCLEDIIGKEVVTMAYPYGAANRRVREATAAAGFRLAACSYASINGSDRDRLLLGRTEITSHDTLHVFRQKLHGNWDWYRWRTQDPACL